MSQPVRYPKGLLDISTTEEFTAVKLASLCDVAERTVYRWYSQGFLDKTDTGQFKVNAAIVPKETAKKAPVQRKYTNDELEEFYLDILSGKREAVIDLGKVIREQGLDPDVLHAVSVGLDEFKEFVVYLIKKA